MDIDQLLNPTLSMVYYRYFVHCIFPRDVSRHPRRRPFVSRFTRIVRFVAFLATTMHYAGRLRVLYLLGVVLLALYLDQTLTRSRKFTLDMPVGRAGPSRANRSALHRAVLIDAADRKHLARIVSSSYSQALCSIRTLDDVLDTIKLQRYRLYIRDGAFPLHSHHHLSSSD